MTESEIFQLIVETIVSATTVGFALGLLYLFIRKR